MFGQAPVPSPMKTQRRDARINPPSHPPVGMRQRPCLRKRRGACASWRSGTCRGRANGPAMDNAAANFAATDILLGESPPMQALRQRVLQAARSVAPVLLLGETGVGKEIVARALIYGARAAAPMGPKQPLITLNCGGLTQALAASELFGHVRGAFTGAHTGHPGAFAAADGGTLFLDEVGELPRDLQPQLLRVLDHGEVRAVGAVQARQVRVRVIAATHQD
ncbi:MAG: sigma-54 factor interaction domain-containing protein, partial [Deltaproteobacteria bacterium]